ncbi:hypothetical protein GIB67_006695, partial [Kingdonia uniflora]
GLMAYYRTIRNPRVVMVGDEGTGKSSLIKTACDKTFPHKDNVPRIMAPTELHVNAVDIGGPAHGTLLPLTAIDTCLHTQESRHNLHRELKQAHIVIVTVSYDKPTSFDRLTSFWLPELQRLKVKAPVIVVACKLDLKGKTQVSLEQIIAPIMQRFLEIDICVDCSARNLTKITVAFFQACKLAAAPLGPLFDKETQTLRPRVVNAFKHIFMVCDRDQNGALSDAELVYLRVGISPALRVLKQGWTAHLWRILYHFGFDTNIILVHDQLPVLLKGAINQKFELTNEAIEYLKSTFSLFDLDKLEVLFFLFESLCLVGFERINLKQVLSFPFFLYSDIMFFSCLGWGLQPAELDKVFSTAPESPWDEVPYKNAGESTPLGSMSLDGFLSKWDLMTLLEPSKSLANLIYIGYRKDPASAFRITKRKGFDCKKEGAQRNVFQCFVFGPKNVGKSELLNAFLGRPFLGSYSSTIKERFAVKCVDYISGTKKTLVLREIPEDEVRHLVSNKESLAACDVAIFIHDSSEKSWNKATDLLIEVASHAKDSGLKVPCLIVTAKDDLDPCGTALKELTQASRQMGLRAPIPVSTKFGDLNDLFDIIVSTAEQPQLSIPVTEAWKISKTENLNDGFDRIKHSAEQPRLSTHPARSLNNSILGDIKNVFSKIISRIPKAKAWRDPGRYYVKLGDVVLDDPDHEKPHQC